jgi:hypothetical protein
MKHLRPSSDVMNTAKALTEIDFEGHVAIFGRPIAHRLSS